MTASHLLDTKVAISLRDGEPGARERARGLESAVLSVVTVVELESGVHLDPAMTAVRRARLDEFLSALVILPFDDRCAAAYGRIVAQCGFSRRRVLDRMIAAAALVHAATVVTANADDFADVPGLQLQQW